MLSSKALQCAFAAAIGLTICGAAHAEDWKVTGSFGWLAVGKAYQIEKGHVYFEDEPGLCKYDALSLRLGGSNEKA